jgi:glycine betaine/proline transport system ATP-binding protein
MEGGRVVQVGSPEEILQNPADDYVRAFFRGVDPTGVISAGDIVRDTHPTIIVSKEGSLRAAHELLSGSERDHGYVLDPKRRFLGVVSSDSLRDAIEGGTSGKPVKQAFIKGARAVQLDESMQDILPEVASNNWPVPVVDENKVYKGVISKNRFLRTLHRTEETVASEPEAEPSVRAAAL